MTRNEHTNYRERFLTRSAHAHGNKYDYSLLPEKFTYKTKVPIVCSKHGIFTQKATSHAQGSNCQKCMHDLRYEKSYNVVRHTKGQFVNKCVLVHGMYYDYSESVYLGQMKSITIKCPRHGAFNICANNHIYGSGCNKCKRSRGETAINNYLMSIGIPYEVQKGFNDLRVPDASEKASNRPKYDFFIPSKRLLIEFDGKQHFEPVRFRGVSVEEAIRLHDRTKFVDLIKNQYAIDNKYELLRISYMQQKLIVPILKNTLSLE